MGASPTCRKVIVWPGPPRRRPAPPERGRSALRVIMTGHCDSQISTGVTALLWGKAIGTMPSRSRMAPRPPCGRTCTLKAPCSRVTPLTLNGQMLPEPAWPCSPSTGQRAPKSTWLMLLVVLARALTGWGCVVFRMLPSGASTRTGANSPSLFGTPGTRAHLKGYIVDERVVL
jgi:hypothetical protein